MILTSGSDPVSWSQEQLEHAEVSTALRYLGQYYFKNKLYDEASLCAQRCCDYNDVSTPPGSGSGSGEAGGDLHVLGGSFSPTDWNPGAFKQEIGGIFLKLVK